MQQLQGNLRHVVAEEQLADVQLMLSQQCSLDTGPFPSFGLSWSSLMLLSNIKSHHTCLKDLSARKWHRTIFHPLFSHSFLQQPNFVFLKISGKIFKRDVIISCGLNKTKKRKPSSKSDAFTWNMEIFAHNSPHCLSSILMRNGSLHFCYSELPLHKPRSSLRLSATLPGGICMWYPRTLQKKSPCRYSHTRTHKRLYNISSLNHQFSYIQHPEEYYVCYILHQKKKKRTNLWKCWKWGLLNF